MINTKETEHITKDVLKCNSCGHERLEKVGVDYECQSECPFCHAGQMMSWLWGGWKDCEARTMHWEIQTLKGKQEKLLKVRQDTEDLSRFTKEEKTVGPSIEITEFGQEVPWFNAFGACMIKVWGIRRRGSLVEFGVGDKKPPIQAWVTADAFYDEWPK